MGPIAGCLTWCMDAKGRYRLVNFRMRGDKRNTLSLYLLLRLAKYLVLFVPVLHAN